MSEITLEFRSSYGTRIAQTFFAIALLIVAANTVSAATYTVTRTDDRNTACAAGDCSLREAVNAANGTAADDTIVFSIPLADPNCNSTTGACTITYTDTAGSDEIIISSTGGALTISGPGANKLTINGGTGSDRIFSATNATFTLRGVTLTSGGGTGATPNNIGGAIYLKNGAGNISGVNFTGNRSSLQAGALYVAGGTFTIANSTFSGNTASSGGAVFVGGGTTNVTVINSTFTGNTSSSGGAFFIQGPSTVSFRNDTIYGNSASSIASGGGGVFTAGTVDMGNTIIAGNTSPNTPEIYKGSGSGLTSFGWNLVGDSAGHSAATFATITYQLTDILDTPPQLDALANYGGGVPTLRPQSSSPVIDSGNGLLAGSPVRDARNVIRPFDNTSVTNASGGDGADIGAFELQTSITKAWGYNENGQLGLGNLIDQTTPQAFSGFSDITQFGGGYQQSVALRADGTVVTTGDDSWGQLGGGGSDGNNRSTFGPVVNLTNIVQVIGGNEHNIALRADGTVWAWGRNVEGELGDGSASFESTTPVQVGAGIAAFSGHVVQISNGNLHSLALTDDGKVWAWGDNEYSDLGDGTFTNRNTPVPVKTSAAGVQLSGVEQVSAGYFHSVALKTDGTVVVWGNNDRGEVGNGTATASGCLCVSYPTQTTNSLMGTIVQVAAGSNFTVAVNTAGDVYAWGDGASGAIGDGNTANALTPRKTSSIANIVRIESRAAFHVIAQRRDGAIFSWGGNPWGAIGNGTTADQTTPINLSAAAGTGGNLGTDASIPGTGQFSSFALTLPTISTPAGAGILRGGEYSVAFPASTQAGTSQVRTFDPTTTGVAVPNGFTLISNAVGYDITTSAQFSGYATVCISVSAVIDPTTFSRLYILHDDDGDGAFDTGVNTRDYQRRLVCRTTQSFSPFVVAQGPIPTAANVTLAGRVMTATGAGLKSTYVTLSDPNGGTQMVLTSSFGYFTFSNVEAGRSYIISVESKRYRFDPRVVSVTSDIADLILTPQEFH